MNIKNLVVAGAMLGVATIVSAQSPNKVQYDFNLPLYAKVVDVDASGNAYVAGTFSSTQDIGLYSLGSNGEDDIFVLKLSPAGEILWAESFGGINTETVTSLAVDNDGNVYIAGDFSDEVDFDPGPGGYVVTSKSGSTDGFVLKLDPDGTFTDAWIVDGDDYQSVQGVAITNSSEVYLTGIFSGDTDLDPTSGLFQVNQPAVNAFFVRIESDGSFGWAQWVGNGTAASGVSATVDATGAPVFAGTYTQSLDINPDSGVETLTPPTENAIFILRLTTAGGFSWGKSIGGDGDVNFPASIFSNVQNDIFITGSFTGIGDFDPGAGETKLTSNGQEDIFIAKFGSSGILDWAQAIGGPESDLGSSIYANDIEVYVTGSFRNSVNFDLADPSHPEISEGETDIFLLKLNTQGDYQWSSRLGGELDETGLSITGDPDHNVITIGQFFSNTDMDPSACSLLLDPDAAPSYFMKISTDPAACQTILQQPVAETKVCSGEVVTLDVLASNVDYYQWQIYDEDGGLQDISDSPGQYSGATSSTLTILTDNYFGEGGYVLRLSKLGQDDIFSEVAIVVVGPHRPFIQDVINCGPGAVTLTAAGEGTPGQYRWYTVPTGGIPISGATNVTYTTPFLTTTTTYYVTIYNGVCEGPRAPVVVNITKCEPPPGLKWAKAWGGASAFTTGGKILQASDGNIIVPGSFDHTVDFDPGPGLTTLTAVAGDGFLMKVTPDGDLLWIKQFSGSGGVGLTTVKEDAAGNLYVGGTYTGVNDFDPGSGSYLMASIPTTRTDAFVAKLDSDGNFLWADGMGGNHPTNGDGFSDIEIDADGVYVTGTFWNSFFFNGTSQGTTSLGSTDVFILKLSTAGALTWFDRIGNSYADGNLYAESVSQLFLDGNNLFVLGNTTQGTTDLDPGTGTHNITVTNGTAYVVRLDINGNFQSAFNYEKVDGTSNGADIAVDKDHNIYVSGNFQDTVDFDPGSGTFSMTTTGSLDAVNSFICKHDPSGNLVWAKAFQVDFLNNVSGGKLVIADNGDIITSGMYQGSIDFDPGPLKYIMSGQSLFLNSYVVKLNGDGEFNWAISLSRSKNVSSSASGGSVIRAGNGDLFMSGSLQGSVDFDPLDCNYELNAAGFGDFYLQKLSFNAANICFDVDPASSSTCSGADGTLTTHAFGAPGVTYQWQKKNALDVFENISDGAGYAGTATSTLTIKTTGGVGVGTYRAIASAPNAADKTSIEAALTLSGTAPDAPTATGAATCNTPASLVLSASGGADGEYRWYDSETGTPDLGETSDTFTTPDITQSTTYYVAINQGGCEGTRTPVTAVVNAGSTAPPVTDIDRCGPGPVTFTASSGTAGQYRWYTSDVGGTPIDGEVNETFTTPSLTTSTAYYVSIALADCETLRAQAFATIQDVPEAPVVSGSTVCLNTAATLTAPVSDGETHWYDVSTGGSIIQIGSSFTTPALQTTTIFYVADFVNACESERTAVTVTLNNCATNQPPAIAHSNASTVIGGSVSIDLHKLISDPDDNIDFTTLKIVVQPKSGALATIDQTGLLSIDYSTTSFVGNDELTIEVCDLVASCAQQVISIKVDGDMVVYNAISPNGDGKNDVFYLEHIEMLDDTRENRVMIYNRWGDLVFDTENYDNTTNVFAGKSNSGKDLSSGTYFYKIDFKSSRKSQTGYLSLKR